MLHNNGAKVVYSHENTKPFSSFPIIINERVPILHTFINYIHKDSFLSPVVTIYLTLQYSVGR